MNANLRNFALWLIIVLLLFALFTLFQHPRQRSSSQDLSFSQLLTEVDQGHVRDVVIQRRGKYHRGDVSVRPSLGPLAPGWEHLLSAAYTYHVSGNPAGRGAAQSDAASKATAALAGPQCIILHCKDFA